MEELKNEKIDIIKWSADPAEFIANALNPAHVLSVFISDTEKACRVVVPDNQLSLAIGKEGQNARLAAKLTGWRIDIKSQSRGTPPKCSTCPPTISRWKRILPWAIRRCTMSLPTPEAMAESGLPELRDLPLELSGDDEDDDTL